MSFRPINRVSNLIAHTFADEEQIKRLRQFAETVLRLNATDGLSPSALASLQEAARKALGRDA